MIGLTSNEAIGLIWGGIGFLTLSYAVSRVIRGSKHGYSIRLQLFFTLFLSSMMSTTLIGWWAINRIEARAVLLFEENGLSAEMIELFFVDFGAKTGLILGLLTLISAGGAWALGRGLASPIERLAAAAEEVSLGEDISSLPRPPGREVRRLREALVSMHEALEDRRQFEVFITDLSHDLKNPVAAIKASVEVLQAGASEEKSSREHFIKRVDEASERLNMMLSDFLSLARLESRGLRFDPEPFSPLLSLKSAIKSQEGIAELKGITIECSEETTSIMNRSTKAHINKGDAAMEEHLVRGSHRWLTRALENIISNAIKFSPSGSTIWIDLAVAPHLSLSSSKLDTPSHSIPMTWYLQISDEGVGVPSSIAEHIFNRFVSKEKGGLSHHANECTSTLFEGTGLGLAIVKRVIGAHRGEITLLTDQDKRRIFNRIVPGAQFLLSLPIIEYQDTTKDS